MQKNKEILIVGAGPSGLAMAMFLNKLGYHPRVIDKKSSIDIHSKALGVNPRTLEILESVNVTNRFLANGRKMQAFNIWKGDKHIYKNEFSQINHKYPFILIQSQKESEEILLEEVSRRGITIEYDTELTELDYNKNLFSAHIDNNGPQPFDYVVGADGGRSVVRESLGIDYEGFSYDEKWELYDVEVDTHLNPDEGHIRVFDEGGMIMIRLHDSVWRVAGNIESILEYLPEGSSVGDVLWTSTFRIHHKIATSLSKGNAMIIGDAAHLHSPVGARGMNLGIEDAFIASRFLHNDSLAEFSKARLPYLRNTVNRINRMTTGFAGNSTPSRMLRKNIGSFRVFFPLVMPAARRFILGLN